MKHLTKTALVKLFTEKGITPSRGLGQHFLIDPNFLKSIPRLAQLTPEDYVLEIGAGPGLLTQYLAQTAKYVWAIEVDTRMVEIWHQVMKGFNNVTLIHDDILDMKQAGLNPRIQEYLFQSGDESSGTLKVVSNLPYNRATAIMLGLLESPLPINSITVMVQWEVAQKLRARPRTIEYNALSVLAQGLTEVRVLKRVPPHIFWPKPEVESALISLIPREPRIPRSTYQVFKILLKTVFRHRRKKIGHTLPHSPDQSRFGTGLRDKERGDWCSLLEEVGLTPDQRPPEITPESYLKLAGKIVSEEIADGSPYGCGRPV